jgi:hypothetical protein
LIGGTPDDGRRTPLFSVGLQEGHTMSSTPAQHVYGTVAPGGAAPLGADHGGGTLPFTGFDAGAFAGIGLLLIVAGLALRGRLTRTAV